MADARIDPSIYSLSLYPCDPSIKLTQSCQINRWNFIDAREESQTRQFRLSKFIDYCIYTNTFIED